MKTNDTTFGKFKDETGDDYYCPFDFTNVDPVEGSHLDTESCVGASTVARYSGNFEISDRFSNR